MLYVFLLCFEQLNDDDDDDDDDHDMMPELFAVHSASLMTIVMIVFP